MTLTGGASAAVVTTESGTYSFASLEDGTYTITPTLEGYTFDPASREVTVAGAEVVEQDFLATAEPAYESTVSFEVAIEPLEELGLYDAARGDLLEVRGSFNDWSCTTPDCVLTEDATDATRLTTTMPVEAALDAVVSYKYFLDLGVDPPPVGWDEPMDLGGANRTFLWQGTDPALGTQFLNDVRPGNIIPAGTSVEVTFRVDMTPALSFETKTPFDPATDDVWVHFQDSLWVYTQSRNLGLEALDILYLSDPEGDMVYEATLTVVGPTYNGIGYSYRFGSLAGEAWTEEGEGGFDAGRRRYQYVLAGTDGTYPLSYTMPLVSFRETGALPFACNPTATQLPETVQALCYEAGTSPPGTAQPAVTFSPMTMAETVYEGSSVTRELVVGNEGTADLSWSLSISTDTGAAWLTASSATGTVAPDAQSSILITMDAANLVAGSYVGVLTFTTNDPARLGVAIPVALTVNGEVVACPWSATATSASGVLQGTATIEGIAAGEADCVAAFDEDGNVAGVDALVSSDGSAFINLTIYGDDATTADQDEGIDGGEAFTLKLHQAATGQVFSYGTALTGWTDTNGSPMPGYDDPATVYDFTSSVTQQLPLQAGWNLTTLSVAPQETAPAALLADVTGQLDYVTGFDCSRGSEFFDPDGLAFLNTLTTMEAGRGYWVKAAEATTLSVTGVSTDASFAVDLCEGWNLIGYWRPGATTPEAAYAELVDAGSLIYVASFDETGATFFDPDGLPFLNTLTEVEAGRGYWVKVNAAVPGFGYPSAATLASARYVGAASAARVERPEATRPSAAERVTPTSRFMFVQGTIRTPDGMPPVGAEVEILTTEGVLVGVAEVLEGGYLRTAAVYGDDPTTPALDGARQGTALHFRYDGVRAATEVTFQPDMRVQQVDLAFAATTPEAPAELTLASNYPNPFNPTTTIRFGLPEAAQVQVAVYDVLGRHVGTLVEDELSAGWHTVRFDAAHLSSGLYVYQVRTAQRTLVRTMHLLK